jgi:hypothetical protein
MEALSAANAPELTARTDHNAVHRTFRIIVSPLAARARRLAGREIYRNEKILCQLNCGGRRNAPR